MSDMENWINIDTPPKYQYLVEVKDEHGNIGKAEATYYPFTFEHRPSKWNSKIIPCEPYWDGGWLILADKGFDSDISGDITHWRNI